MKKVRDAPGSFDALRQIIATLRGPEGCPWDKEQTHQSLKPFLLEEASEALEALDEGDHAHLAEELGDLLLQIMLHAQIAEEAGEFSIEDVIDGLARKLVRRHPHVFGEKQLRTAGQVVEQWDELKREERSEAGSVLAGVPATLPALARAQALQRRAVRAGFAWESSDQAWQKLEEELDELRQSETGEERLQEAGDVLFALTEVLRQWDVDAEEALRLGCRRFSQAFERMEERLASERRDFPDLSLNEKLSLWRESKGL